MSRVIRYLLISIGALLITNGLLLYRIGTLRTDLAEMTAQRDRCEAILSGLD